MQAGGDEDVRTGAVAHGFDEDAVAIVVVQDMNVIVDCCQYLTR